MSAELDWSYSIAEIPDAGLTAERSATPAMRTALATALDLLACSRLEVRYEVNPLPRGRYVLEGTLEADVTQSCVVTLEPVESRIVEPFEVEFRPGLAREASEVTEFDALEARDIEPLEDGTIPIGRIVYEHLASAINPYPRKEGVVLEQPSSEPTDAGGESGPFAALRQLKPKN